MLDVHNLIEQHHSVVCFEDDVRQWLHDNSRYILDILKRQNKRCAITDSLITGNLFDGNRGIGIDFIKPISSCFDRNNIRLITAPMAILRQHGMRNSNCLPEFSLEDLTTSIGLDTAFNDISCAISQGIYTNTRYPDDIYSTVSIEYYNDTSYESDIRICDIRIVSFDAYLQRRSKWSLDHYKSVKNHTAFKVVLKEDNIGLYKYFWTAYEETFFSIINPDIDIIQKILNNFKEFYWRYLKRQIESY